MSGTLLITVIIVLSEIMLIVAIAAVWFIRRARKRKSPGKTDGIELQATGVQASAEPEQPDINAPSPLDYLEAQISRTNERLAELAPEQEAEQSALQARLAMLETEKNLHAMLGRDASEGEYWDLIQQHYQPTAAPAQKEDAQAKRDAVYLARIKNLENFKAMFISSQEQLKGSFNVINELKGKIGNMSASEETAQLEDMVDTLSIDNINLNKKLSDAQEQLQRMIEEMEELRAKLETQEIDSEFDHLIEKLQTENTELQSRLEQATQELQSIEENSAQPDTDAESQPNTEELTEQLQSSQEENEFLTVQIEHLLKQETERTAEMEAQIAQLQASISEQEQNTTGTEDQAQLEHIQDENEFLVTQIEFLLKQETERTAEMEAQIAQLQASISEQEQNTTGTEDQAQLEHIQEENEFLVTQIEFLLKQETERTAEMEAQIAQLQASISEQESHTSPPQQEQTSELTDKLEILEADNEFLNMQIEQLLHQEVEHTEQLNSQIKQLQAALNDKDIETASLSEAAHKLQDMKDLIPRVQELEEENAFLCSQIEHLLQQEVETNNAMQDDMKTLETALESQGLEDDPESATG